MSIIFFILVILFIISIGAYTPYDRQIAFFQNQNDLRILEAQNRYYRTQLDIIRENNETIKRIEHDLKNTRGASYATTQMVFSK